jgi:hypothetical protein
MKQLFFFIGFLLATMVANSQYHPILSEAHIWKGITYGWGQFDFYQHLDGDSIIGEQIWKKLYSGNSLDESGYLIGLLREDSTQQKVYFWNNGEEHLIYDFDVEVGDDVSSWGAWMEQNLTITSVENVVVDGTNRKKIGFDDQWGEAYWIEGMGSVYGLLDGALGNIVDYSPVITCFYHDNDLIWDNPEDNSVCGAVLNVEEFLGNEPKLYPNPFDDYIKIDWNMGDFIGEKNIRIYSSTGLLVHESNMYSDFIVAEGLQDVASGLYTLSIQLDGKPLVSGRILKK